MPASYDEYNDAVKEWARTTTTVIKSTASGLGIIHRRLSPSPGASVAKIKDQVKYRKGAISMISFKFPRTLIFTHKGAGKGIGGFKGSRWINSKGEQKRTATTSLGKIGTSSRKEKPFFNITLDGAGGMELLATIVAEKMGDTIVDNILIP